MAIFISTCLNDPIQEDDTDIVGECIEACEAVMGNASLEEGPCLLDPMEGSQDWVCDVAHDPREPEDDLPDNQCSSYLEGRARHFVEVRPDCSFIRQI
jgi:hypothetical protein